ncbi:MAG TPA: ATP-binding protein [Rhizomicrobium sp.]|jgi:signal transduction histidine kinase
MTEPKALRGAGATFADRADFLYPAGRVPHLSTAVGAILLALTVIVALFAGGDALRLAGVLVAVVSIGALGYCSGVGQLLNENIRLRREGEKLTVALAHERSEHEAANASVSGEAAAKALFIANVSHEIRTPLNAMLGMAQLLERAELERPYRDHVKVMLEASRGLQTLLDDVITLSNQDSVYPVSEEGCDPEQVARGVARLLQPLAWEKRLRLNVVTPAQLPHVRTDPRHIRQTLLKLTENALKFTERGGVEIRVELETAADGEQTLRFSVTDTGLGIPQEVAAHLFEPFKPGDASYARRHQGLGLGLAVARNIVTSLHGRIGFESEPGEGAVFWFRVPVVHPVATTQNVISQSVPPPSGRSLLVHLGDAKMCETLAAWLEPFGNTLTQAADITNAVMRASRESFDVIVTGASNADTIAALPGNRTPVLAIVCNGERASAAATATLRWPADRPELFDALRFVTGSEPAADTSAPSAIDAPGFAALEKSVGLATLVEILQSYIKTAEELSVVFADACTQENWEEAARVAQDMAGAASGLGLAAMTGAARSFAQKARDGEEKPALRSAAQAIVGEHNRARAALVQLYPDLAA